MGIGQHLTQQQISAWLVGERSSEAIQHIRNCAACRAEVLLLGTTLVDFRTCVRDWSQQHTTAVVITAPGSLHHSFFTFNRACLATAAAILCILLGVSLRSSHPTKPVSAFISDRALMNRVDDEISRTVPTAMDPLLPLVAWQSNESNDGAAN
ncbi:MAG: hypothetical protein WA324_07270 [Bryobacteraceae bacterium]